VSNGPAPVAIPSVVGVDVGQAQPTLEQLGLVVKTSQGFSDTIPPNAVISQDPAPGAGHRRDVVTLIVSKGPEYIPVPDVRGQPVEAAQKTLTDTGFQVDVRKSALYVNQNIVAVQTPPGGQTARVGTVIVLEIV
jgi:eukaryotic-like serine/threonine-protein kinase